MINPVSLWEDAVRRNHWHICNDSGSLCGAELADVNYYLPDHPFLNVNLCLDCWGRLTMNVRHFEDMLNEMLGSYTVEERIKLLVLWNESLRAYIPEVEPESGYLANLHAFIDMTIEALQSFGS